MWRFFYFKVITALILSFCFGVLILSGIRTIPPIGVSVVLGYMASETIILQFWLASDGTQAGFWSACEKGVNFLLYNLPIVTFFMTMLWLSNFVLTSIFINGSYAFNAGSALLSIDQLRVNQARVILPLQFMVFRYAKLLVDFFWVACLVTLYRRYHRVSYADSVLR